MDNLFQSSYPNDKFEKKSNIKMRLTSRPFCWWSDRSHSWPNLLSDGSHSSEKLAPLFLFGSHFSQKAVQFRQITLGMFVLVLNIQKFTRIPCIFFAGWPETLTKNLESCFYSLPTFLYEHEANLYPKRKPFKIIHLGS